jgi:hypothetical protein
MSFLKKSKILTFNYKKKRSEINRNALSIRNKKNILFRLLQL